MKIGRYLLGFILLMMILIVFGDRGFVDYYSQRGRLRSLQDANARITKENAALKEEILLLTTDERYIERVAREELGMVKKGEIVYRFVD